MTRNTSCDSHSRSEHDQCSPQQACDQVKAKAVQSDLFPIPLWLGSVTLENPFIDALVPLAEFELEVDVRQILTCLHLQERSNQYVKM